MRRRVWMAPLCALLCAVAARADELAEGLEKPPVITLAEEKDLVVWVEPPEVKVHSKLTPETATRPSKGINLHSARNEYESVQVVIRSGRDLGAVCLEYAPLTRPGGGLLPSESLVWRPVGLVEDLPDPLLQSEPFNVGANETRSLWLTLYAPADARPGEYATTLALKSNDVVLSRFRLTLRVRSFALPEMPYLKTAFQFSLDSKWNCLDKYYPDTGRGHPKNNFALNKAAWENMARHRVAPMQTQHWGPPRQDGNGKIDFSEYDRYLDLARKLRFNHLLPFHWAPPLETEEDRAWIRAVTDHLAERGQLKDTFVYMPHDEAPPEVWPKVREYATKLRETEPRLLRMLTVTPHPDLVGSIDVWCPYLVRHDPALTSGCHDRGEKVWWYGSQSGLPFTGLLIDQPGCVHRALFWQTWTLGMDGMLCWCINFWPEDPWTQTRLQLPGRGDGYLLYPRRNGDPPCFLYDSQRWELVREGMEDYDYFWMLREEIKLGEKEGKVPAGKLAKARKALQLVNKVTPGESKSDLQRFSLRPSDYAHVRSEVAAALEELYLTRQSAR